MTTTHADRIETIEDDVRSLKRAVLELRELNSAQAFGARHAASQEKPGELFDEVNPKCDESDDSALAADPLDVYVPRAGDVIAAWNESDHVALAVWRRVVINDKEYLPAYDDVPSPWALGVDADRKDPPQPISSLAQPVRFVRFATHAERVAVGLPVGQAPKAEPKEEHPSPVRVVVEPEPTSASFCSPHSLTLRELVGQTMFVSLSGSSSGAVRDRHLVWARLEPAVRQAYLAAADAVLELMTDDSLAAKRPTSPAREGPKKRELRLGDVVRVWYADWIVTAVNVDGTLDGTSVETLGRAKSMRSTFMGILAGECRYVRESTMEERVEAGVRVEREAAPAPAPRPRVVCLCGSTRFKSRFMEESKRLGLEGKIVLSIACFPHTDDGASPEEALGEDAKRALDELHRRKIDMADEVFVLNVGGYIGESTRGEIQYAWDHRKTVTFLEPVDDIYAPAAAQSAAAWGGKRRADVCCPSCGSERPETRRTCGNINDRYPCRDAWHGAEKKEPARPERPEPRVTPAKPGSRVVRLLADVVTPDGVMRRGTVAWVSNWDATTGRAIVISTRGDEVTLDDDQWEAMP